MGYFIGAAVLAIIGIFLWIGKNKKENKSGTLATHDTSDIKDVMELYESMRNSMGDGSFTHYVEIKGAAHTDSPITSELSNEPVVYYQAKVVHEYKKLERTKNSQGQMEEKWVDRSETVSDNSRWAPGFGVKDDTGFIEVDATKAELHTEKLHSNYEPVDSGANSAMNIKIGSFSIGLGQKTPGIRSMGYRSEEFGIRMNTRLYVIGDANDRDSRLIVSKSLDKKQPFIVSVKSEDELMSGLESGANGMKWGAFVCFGLAAVAAVAGVLNLIGVF